MRRQGSTAYATDPPALPATVRVSGTASRAELVRLLIDLAVAGAVCRAAIFLDGHRVTLILTTPSPRQTAAFAAVVRAWGGRLST